MERTPSGATHNVVSFPGRKWTEIEVGANHILKAYRADLSKEEAKNTVCRGTSCPLYLVVIGVHVKGGGTFDFFLFARVSGFPTSVFLDPTAQGESRLPTTHNALVLSRHVPNVGGRLLSEVIKKPLSEAKAVAEMLIDQGPAYWDRVS